MGKDVRNMIPGLDLASHASFSHEKSKMSHFYVSSLHAWGNDEKNFFNFFNHRDRLQRTILRRKSCRQGFFCDFLLSYTCRNKKKNIFSAFFPLLRLFLTFYNDFSDEISKKPFLKRSTIS